MAFKSMLPIMPMSGSTPPAPPPPPPSNATKGFAAGGGALAVGCAGVVLVAGAVRCCAVFAAGAAPEKEPSPRG